MGGIWGNRWHVTIWKVVYDIKRPGIERNPNLEIYCYEPKYQSLDDSVNMDDDADELELLLTVNDEINTTMARIAQLPSMHGIITVN